MFRISYSVESETNWYRVKLHEIESSILVHKNSLAAVVGMTPGCVVGCTSVTIDQVYTLGFFPAIEQYVLSKVGS